MSDLWYWIRTHQIECRQIVVVLLAVVFLVWYLGYEVPSWIAEHQRNMR